MVPITLKRKVIGLNKFLQKVYSPPMLMSIFLKKNGFSPEQIETIRLNHMEAFVDATIDLINDSFAMKPRLLLVIKKTYSFTGEKHYTLEEIGKELGVSRERVRQLKEKAFRRFRTPRSK